MAARGNCDCHGDFNVRLGEIPNILNLADPESNYDRRAEIERTSEDNIKSRNGKELMETLNVLNMVVLNGVRDKAEFTCNQANGNSVIDLVCVDLRALNLAHNLCVWDDDWSVDLSPSNLLNGILVISLN